MEGNFDLNTKTQMCGTLMKKPFGHQSNKWSKRFFVVKDGYLLYYGENERKEMEKRKMFNIHPKGVIPLGDCVIEPLTEPGHIFSINIRNEEFPLNTVILAAETEWEREKWINSLQKAKRITWNNAKLGEEMIQHLENQGLYLAQEKQTYRDKFQNEAIALVDEKERREQLEVVHNELEKEKRKLEEFLEQLQDEQKELKRELTDTATALKKLATDRDETKQKSSLLEQQLQRLAEEKESTIEKLSERETLTRQLSVENENLSQTKNELNKRLSAIENETQKLLQEKRDAEERLRMFEERARLLEEEKVQIAEHADELQTSIKDLREQKTVTENELREEVIARLETERRLQNAEAELANLENKLKQDGTKYTADDKEEMICNVTKLKEFFENLAMEAKMEDKKPILMQTTYTARKSFIVRSKSKRYQEKRRKRVQSMKSRSYDDLSRLNMNFINDSQVYPTYADTIALLANGSEKSNVDSIGEKSVECGSNGSSRRGFSDGGEDVSAKQESGGEESSIRRSSTSSQQAIDGQSVESSKPNGLDSPKITELPRPVRRSDSMEKAKENELSSLDRPKSSSKSRKSRESISHEQPRTSRPSSTESKTAVVSENPSRKEDKKSRSSDEKKSHRKSKSKHKHKSK